MSTHSKIPTFFIIAFSLFLLTSCGGGGGGGEPPTPTPPTPSVVSISAKVIDGYITGANVYIDFNWNLQQDEGEPSAEDDGEGSYYFDSTTFDAIENVSNECTERRLMIAEVPVGAVDSNRGTVDEAFTMYYVPGIPRGGIVNISPFTGLFLDIVSSVKADLNLPEITVANGCGSNADAIADDVIAKVIEFVEELDGVREFPVPVAQLVGRRGPGFLVAGAQQLAKQPRPALVDAPVGPHRLELVVSQPGVVRVESRDPVVESLLDGGGLLLPELTLGPVTVAVLRALQDPDQLFSGGSINPGSILQLLSLRRDAPDSSGMAVSSFVTQRVLGVSLDRVVPVSDVHRSTWAEANINWYEAQVGGEDDVADIFFVIPELGFLPAVELDPVGGLVARLDIATLELFGEGLEVDEFLSTGS